ncbi:ATP-binding protein [Blastococcus montanus]|uniref:sensor histidine kinase n=1 Tax=Blastococcus montanus TaxID=3144973 RepID=UPI00320BA6B8
MTTTVGRAGPRGSAVLAGGTALLGGVLTIAVVSVSSLQFAYRAPTLQIMLETVNAIVALIVGFLLYGRFRRSRQVRELLLVLALCALAVANLVLTALPAAVSGDGHDPSQWAALGTRLLGTGLLALAVLVPRRLRLGRGGAGWMTLSFVAVLVVVASVGAVWAADLPPTIDPSGSPADPSLPRLIPHPAVLAVQAVGALAYGWAAIRLVRQSRSGADELISWLAAGFVLGAFARLHYFLFPSLYTEYVYSGDLLRLGAYLLMLTGAVREIQSFWQVQAEAAVAEDRRRLARDLHDGLTQELTYIRGQARQLARRPSETVTVERIGGAADRAIDEARRAIAALAQPLDEPFPQVLRQVVEETAERYEVAAATDVSPAAETSPARGEALLRIAAEAVRNAARHGDAGTVRVVLTAEPLRLTVVDDGRGFDPATTRPGGFGLTSMRERAAAAGARFSIESALGKGTTVEVVWP